MSTHLIHKSLLPRSVEVLPDLSYLTPCALPGDRFLLIDYFCQLCDQLLSPLNTMTLRIEIETLSAKCSMSIPILFKIFWKEMLEGVKDERAPER